MIAPLYSFHHKVCAVCFCSFSACSNFWHKPGCFFICLLRAVVLPLIVFNVVKQKSHFALILETFVKYSHNNDLGAILINN